MMKLSSVGWKAIGKHTSSHKLVVESKTTKLTSRPSGGIHWAYMSEQPLATD